MNYKVFYSWQSDSPNSTNRGFIETALTKAAEMVAKDETIGIVPIIDRDTKNVPGSPEIGSTIFSKIDGAQAFVCDVTIINPRAEDRLMPNPNVMLELGYAAKSLGWDNIVMVINTRYGSIQDLPFDLRTRRVVPYEAEAGEEDRSSERKKLVNVFDDALRAMASNAAPSEAAGGVEIIPSSLAELAIEAVEHARPNQAVATRRFTAWILEELEHLAPVWSDKKPLDDQLVDAVDATLPVAVEFASVVDMIATLGAAEPARIVYRSFEAILEKYDLTNGFSGNPRSTDFDFYKFIGHEFFTMFISALMRNERWELIAELLQELFHPENMNTDRRKPAKEFIEFSQHVELLRFRNERLKLNLLSVHATSLVRRHSTGELGKYAPIQDFLDADSFLFLRGEFSAKPEYGFAWLPWSYLYQKKAPKFLWSMQNKRRAEAIVRALGTDVETARREIRPAFQRLSKLWQGGFWENGGTTFDGTTIATK